jgi:anti-anti-sigma factor
MENKLGLEVLPVAGAAGITLVRVDGKLHSGTYRLLEERLIKLVSEGKPRLILDLVLVPFISSAGMRAILNISKAASDAGGSIKIAALAPEIKQTFLATGLQNAFGIHESVAEAIAAF